MTHEPASLDTPMGLALVICDAIVEDKHTGKKTLVGLFDRLFAARFPCVHHSMGVFVTLTGCRGVFPCEVVCRHLDDSTVAFSAKGEVQLRDPRQVVDLVFRLHAIRFPKPGTYWLQFQVDGVPIMMRPLAVQEQKAAPGGEQASQAPE